MIDIVGAVKKIYSLRDESGTGFYSKYDWDRLSYVSSLPFFGSILDVGCGNGSLLHMLAMQHNQLELTGMDVRRHSKLILPPSCSYVINDLRKQITFAVRYDYVICMEVLEHLEVGDLKQAIANLRAAYSKFLLCTVPLNEPEPVWWHDKPGGHRQSFSLDKIVGLFPNAVMTVVKNHKVDWMMIGEGKGILSGFKVIDNAEFAKFFHQHSNAR